MCLFHLSESRSRLLSLAERIWSMQVLPLMIEVVAMMNFLSGKSVFKKRIAAISAKVTPPMK